ncbi:MAG: HDOD domain-containing protein [Nitrospirales bacterium]
MISTTEPLEADSRTLCVSGRFELQNLHRFNIALDAVIHSNPQKIILNFSQVSYINAEGLALLLAVHRKLEEVKIGLTLEVASGFVLDLLTKTNVGEMIQLSHIDAHVVSSGTSQSSVPSRSPSIPSFEVKSDEMDALLFPILKILEQETLDLPLLPEVASQVLSLMADPDATANSLARVIQQDPVLMANIFKIANSAANGASQKIVSLQQAITWLGQTMVESLTIALSLQANVFNDRGYQREVRGLWAHAIATAYYGKTLARLIGASPDNAFMCGLLHTIGKFVVIHHFNESRGDSPSVLRWSVMENILEQSYIEVGRELADLWNFPSAVKEAITQHQEHSYRFATHPLHGAAITCLAGHVATSHLDSVPVEEETLLALPVAVFLNIPESIVDEIQKTKNIVQTQVDSLLL